MQFLVWPVHRTFARQLGYGIAYRLARLEGFPIKGLDLYPIVWSPLIIMMIDVSAQC